MTTLRASIYEPGDNAFFSLLFEPKWTVNRRHEVCCQSFWHITREIALKRSHSNEASISTEMLGRGF